MGGKGSGRGKEKVRKGPFGKAIRAAGGVTALAEKIGVSHQTITQWRVVPPLRVRDVEAASGVPAEELRPDIFRPSKKGIR